MMFGDVEESAKRDYFLMATAVNLNSVGQRKTVLVEFSGSTTSDDQPGHPVQTNPAICKLGILFEDPIAWVILQPAFE